MQRKFNEHLISIVFIGMIFVIIQIRFSAESAESTYTYPKLIREFTQLEFLDLSSPEDRMLLREALDFYDPNQSIKHDSLIAEISNYLNDQMLSSVQARDTYGSITVERLIDILWKLLKFAIVYILVLMITYYGVETFAIYRFIRTQHRDNFILSIITGWRRVVTATRSKDKAIRFGKLLSRIGRRIVKFIITLILFAPAYVIAYSFKTRFDTDSILLMILLGVISNGLLITYSQKYFTFLISESRKGYVQTATVKNLKNVYLFNKDNGIPFSSIFRLKKKFPGHVFEHIYENVQFQYLETLKEQASFLITGLIIIEMALNIQGHLCYELMQNILYKNLAVVLIIIFGIFFIVKLTEIVIDYIALLHRKRIDNRQPGLSK